MRCSIRILCDSISACLQIFLMASTSSFLPDTNQSRRKRMFFFFCVMDLCQIKSNGLNVAHLSILSDPKLLSSSNIPPSSVKTIGLRPRAFKVCTDNTSPYASMRTFFSLCTSHVNVRVAQGLHGSRCLSDSLCVTVKSPIRTPCHSQVFLSSLRSLLS